MAAFRVQEADVEPFGAFAGLLIDQPNALVAGFFQRLA